MACGRVEECVHAGPEARPGRAAKIPEVADLGHALVPRAKMQVIERGGPDFGPMPPVAPRFIHVCEDVEQGWAEVGPYVANDRNSYGAWAVEAGLDTGQRAVTDELGLRDDPEYRVLTPEQCVELLRDLGPSATLPMTPMAGGVPPEVAWSSLRLLVDRVVPEL